MKIADMCGGGNEHLWKGSGVDLNISRSNEWTQVNEQIRSELLKARKTWTQFIN